MSFSTLPPDSRTLVSKWNTKLALIWKEDVGPLGNSPVLLLLSPGKTPLMTTVAKNGQRVACKNLNVYSPQRQNNLIFFWLLYSGLGKAVAGINPGCAMQLDALAFLPHLTDIAPPPPPTIRLCSLRSAGLVKRVWPAGSVAAGSDGCLLGRIHFPCGYVVYVLLCCWGVFPVLTLYSPRSIVWELFFFSSLSSCKCCIFLQFYLHFTTDYTCMIVYVTNNKEPWTLKFLDTSVCGALDALTPASVHSLWSSPKFLNRFCLTILIRLRFSRLVLHLFLQHFLPLNFLLTCSFAMNVCGLPSLWRVSMIVFWTTVRSAVFPIIV